MNSYLHQQTYRVMSGAERRRIVEAAITEMPHYSNRWLAEICGVSPPTIARYRAELEKNTSSKHAVEAASEPQPPTERHNTMTSPYNQYSARELREFTNAKTPTPINLILDWVTVDFLLGLNTNNRRLRPEYVDILIESINTIGWKTTETFCVTDDGQLGNGQHRLTALKRLGYPDDICATVVFGVDKASVLVIDQHSKRTASASLKMSVGRSCDASLLSAIRQSLLFNPETMALSTGFVPPSRFVDKLDEWETYASEMPLLFHRQFIGTKRIKLTSAMIVAIVHYRQRAGVVKANEFLHGFWGRRDCSANSPEQKARNFRLTVGSIRGNSGERSVYRIFAWLLIAHYEGRNNPTLREANDWGTLKSKRTI